MRVLTVYAHNNPRSFCHGVLDRFSAGLADAGHESQVLDLYAMNFDPVLRDRDTPSWTNGNIPEDIADLHDVRGQVLRTCRNPLQRWLVNRAIRGKSQAEICGMLRTRMPKDVLAMHEKIKWADGLAFIAPIHFCSFPAMLKGWIDRVWCYDFAFGLTSAGWHGDVNGRIPLLHHKRALIMTSTIFNKAAYDDGIRDAIGKVMDEWGFRYPGIEDVEHVYFYAATSATPELVQRYFQQAYELGREFALPAAERNAESTPPAATPPAA
jgi:NAD(P)H dehydrogenase (quinone)